MEGKKFDPNSIGFVLILGYYFGLCGKISLPKLILGDKVKKGLVIQDAKTKEAEGT
jgi:hypothetical protein